MLRPERREPALVSAKTVIDAAGGAGWLYYPHCDCSAGATGDGYTLAYDAAPVLTDMEQVQFVPFGMTHPSSMRACSSVTR
jgi:succinate dehydrogenase/fumarate reductase flavoprotein subunit